MIFRKRADLLTPPHNYAIVQLPGRNYPGVVFQGDSLNALCTNIGRIVQELSKEDTRAEALECLKFVHEDLIKIRDGYEHVLNSRKIKLPYFNKE